MSPLSTDARNFNSAIRAFVERWNFSLSPDLLIYHYKVREHSYPAPTDGGRASRRVREYENSQFGQLSGRRPSDVASGCKSKSLDDDVDRRESFFLAIRRSTSGRIRARTTGPQRCIRRGADRRRAREEQSSRRKIRRRKRTRGDCARQVPSKYIECAAATVQILN